MNSDEQIALLREIRDILLEQNRLVDKQWAEYSKRWDDQERRNKRSTTGCLSSIFVVVILFVIWAVIQVIHSR